MLYIFALMSCLLSFSSDEDKSSFTIEKSNTEQAISIHTPLKSSAKILVFHNTEFAGHGSGNYVKYGKHKFMITAAHVVDNPLFKFILDGDELVELEIAYIDEQRDVAIVVPKQELKTIKPIAFRTNNKSDLTGEVTYYAGYPQEINKAVFRGFVSLSTPNTILMQSVALPGSSGSMVFDFWGRAIGVVSAVKLGMFRTSPYPELIESLVFVERVDFIDKKLIKEIFENVGSEDP